MRLPDLVAYQAAVQHPSTAFMDPQLRAATVATSRLGLPRAVAGNFAVTYQLGDGSRRWAVRCFHREVSDRASRYAVISRSLARVPNGPLVPIEHIELGVRVGASWYPITKMRWLDGYPLNRVVESSLSRPGALLELERRFVELVADLRRRGIAHGDLQHGNVLVDDSSTLHLVDYDGMYVPGLKGRSASETGDPNYQHPRRSTQFDTELDNFASIVIVVALRALAASPSLWRTYNTGDNLLFRRSDFADPSASPLFRELASIASVRELSERLAQASTEDYSRVPRLEDLLHRSPKSRGALPKPIDRTSPARSWKLRRAAVQRAIAMSADGLLVASADLDGKITVRQAASGHTKTNLQLRARGIVSLAFTRGGELLAATVDRSSVNVWSVTNQRRMREFSVRLSSGAHAALSSGGGWLSVSSDGTVQFWSAANGRLVGQVRVLGAVTAVAVSPDGRYIAASARGHVLVWRCETRAELCRITCGSGVTTLSFASERLLVGTARGDVTLWDINTGRLVMALSTVAEPVQSVALAPDGQRYVGAGGSGGVWLRRVSAARNRPRPARVTRLPRVVEWLRRVALL